MKPLLSAILITSAIVVTAILAAPPAATPVAPSNGARVPVVLELFTSEGCSSCPPADQLLESLDRQPVGNADLIVLSEHVDYWNYLGWSDPYSSAFFSDRQQKYSQRLGATVYTPQLVIDGQFAALGSDRQEVTQAIGRAASHAKLPVSVRVARSGNADTVHVEANSGGVNADLYLAIAADRASTQVLRGENGGHKLTHVAVAESVTRIGKWEGSGAAVRDVPLPAMQTKQAAALFAARRTGETRVIATLQDPRTGRILGAAQMRF